ncbi:hydroxymethylglutaryl-CoA synthase [Physcomitrium patens]|uniref:Hydroxymethylglutaryl-CoA synthase n=2 Tax=Physcomitrium patens TaxID=3218 RepID=A0A2K1KL74_PHYPA|nr:hydroxymethylglutaryl-CoA synthase-like [Physcomitrium patens]PNR54527.1 hypothetical protein PHYPA_008204 [Physcomitrium patens]|eukprot:XP_024374898.1 hydroxymethylglutaryl-CoA synthase-like [Physcomitrella patens]
MTTRPQNVGILAMDVYFPASYVHQEALEEHDGVSKGKYTIGLGQDRLAFCTDLEDVISMSLTVVKSLLEKYGIAPESIGRLEVGSETVIDKSKAIKTCLMQLFEESGNGDIEGVDSTNACYGGTAALQNSLNWVESSAWDGRYAIVVAADSAVYAEGAARPTGGAGAVAMLIGPNAPIVFERCLSGTHMANVYDFYKPNLASEYPIVDGKLSQTCYLQALDSCYRRFCEKYEKHSGKPFTLSDASYVVCHAPYNKLVQKSFARLVYNDYIRNASFVSEDAAALFEPFATLSPTDSLLNRDLEKVSQQVAKKQYDVKVAPTTMLPKELGNMYCASLYAGLATLVHNKSSSLDGQRILLFSYGSGLASSLFSCKFVEGQKLAEIAEKMDIAAKLQSRIAVTPTEFVETMHLMETRYGAKDFIPVSSKSTLRPMTYYITQVDNLYRRSYDRYLTKADKVEANGVHGLAH